MIKMYIGLHVKYPFACPILIKLNFSRQIFEKSSNNKFHENPSNGSRVVTCAWTDRRADMTKLIIPFRNYANAPQNVAAGHVTGSAGRGLDTSDIENQWEYLTCQEKLLSLVKRTNDSNRQFLGLLSE
jgi:hypothetical protein